MTLRTRFAPSPTGVLHLGGARTALFCWLYARRFGGRFIVRLEDTDRERSTAASVDAILEGLAWLGIDSDEGPFFQSQRTERYRAAIARLLESGRAYRCYCTRDELEAMRAAQRARKEKPRYDGRCRHRAEPRAGVEPAIRFRNPERGATTVDDLIHGPVTFRNDQLDDLIIARSDGSPTYNLTVVVDDLEMGMTHVIRGDDHLNNTPRQINLFAALDATPPRYAHMPMILGADGARLSKRHGALNLLEYRDAGYLPEALINCLARLGWSDGDRELFTVAELIERFDVAAVNRAAAAFDPNKLLHLNQHYIKSGDPERIGDLLRPHLAAEGIDAAAVARGPALAETARAQRERAKTLVEMAQNSLYLYREFDAYDAKAARKHLTPTALAPLTTLRDRFAALPEWRAEALHAALVAVAEQGEMKLGKIAQPLRVAATGGAVSPPIDVTLELLGRERSLQRLERALASIRARAPEAATPDSAA